MRTYQFSVSRYSKERVSLGEALQLATKLSPQALSEAASKGAVWLQKQGKGKILREREISSQVDPSDKISLYYDQKILSLPAFQNPAALEDNQHYGVWIKPAGIMPQGTQASDHTSILRAVEKVKGRDVFLVHRLDRETEGLMIIAYSSQSAAKLSDLFQKNHVTKIYQAVVAGKLPMGEKKIINASLDDKEAITHYEVIFSGDRTSLLKVRIETGRLHQIRRHLDHIGHPVMGDPKYGQGNKNKEGLKLLAYSLSFFDPWKKEQREWKMDKQLAC